MLTAQSRPRQMKPTRDAYGEALLALGAERPDLVALDAGVSDSTRSQLFGAKYPERFFNVGIAEANMIDIAAGLALAGKTVFASSFAIFVAGRAWEQVRQTVAYTGANVTLVGTHAGITIGEDGASAQMNEDIALMRVLPGMTVVCPADAVETVQAVRALADHAGPAYLRLGRNPVPVVFDEEYRFEIGRATVLRPGQHVSILATGILVAEALDAAAALAGAGVEVEVVNVSTIKPLDVETVLESARRTGAVVTAEEHNVIGGLGSAIAEALAERHPVPLVRVGIQDCFGRSGTPAQLKAAFGISAADVVAAVQRVLGLKR